MNEKFKELEDKIGKEKIEEIISKTLLILDLISKFFNYWT